MLHGKIEAKSVKVDGASVATQDADGRLAQRISASRVDGVFPIANIPAAALERLYDVVDNAARFALTETQVQNGDVVQVGGSSGLLYIVVDQTKLDSEDGYRMFTAGQAATVPWSGVTSMPAFVAALGAMASGALGYLKKLADNTVAVLTALELKTELGLNNVDNTSDASKPVSSPQQSALDLKASVSALSAHIGNSSNPHSVTKTQVELGNVPNVDTSNASNISSGVLAAARGGAGTVSGIMKANGSGAVSAATAGTDYVPPTTTVNGHALSANVTVTAGDVSLGNVSNYPVATQLEAITGADKYLTAQHGARIWQKFATKSILPNFAMENWDAGTTSVPTGWAVVYATVAINASGKRGNCALLTATQTGAVYMYASHVERPDFLKTLAGRTITLSFWGKCAQAQGSFRAVLSSNDPGEKNGVAISGTTWQKAAVSCTLGDTLNSLWIDIQCTAVSIGDAFYIDEVELTLDPMNNLAAAAAPANTDDYTKGYSAGSLWVYNGKTYVYTSAAGTMVWKELTTDTAERRVMESPKSLQFPLNIWNNGASAAPDSFLVGTTSANGATVAKHTADFYGYVSGGGSSACAKVTATSPEAATYHFLYIDQTSRPDLLVLLAGRTVTFSFYAKEVSGYGGNIFAEIDEGVTTYATAQASASSWTRFSVSHTFGASLTAFWFKAVIYTGSQSQMLVDRFQIDFEPQHNFAATAAPTVNDDYKKGYSPGSRWIYAGIVYNCTSSAAGAAVWEGPSTAAAARAGTDNTNYITALAMKSAFDLTTVSDFLRNGSFTMWNAAGTCPDFWFVSTATAELDAGTGYCKITRGAANGVLGVSGADETNPNWVKFLRGKTLTFIVRVKPLSTNTGYCRAMMRSGYAAGSVVDYPTYGATNNDTEQTLAISMYVPLDETRVDIEIQLNGGAAATYVLWAHLIATPYHHTGTTPPAYTYSLNYGASMGSLYYDSAAKVMWLCHFAGIVSAAYYAIWRPISDVSNPNILINGDCSLTCYASTITGITSVFSDVYCVDTWLTNVRNTGVITYTRDTDVPTKAQSGYKAPYSMCFTATTAFDDAANSGDCYMIVQHIIVGRDWAPQTLKRQRLSAWVKSKLTGTMGATLYTTAGGGASIALQASITAAETWQKVEFTVIALDNTYAVDDSAAMAVSFYFQCGSTGMSGALGAWQGGGYRAYSGQTNFFANVNDYVKITQIKLEEGEVATVFTRDPERDELRARKRVRKMGYAAQALGWRNTATGNGDVVWNAFPLSPPMRAAPTVTVQGTWTVGANNGQPTAVGTPSVSAFMLGVTATASGLAYAHTTDATCGVLLEANV